MNKINRNVALLSREERKRTKANNRLKAEKKIVDRFEALCKIHGASDATVMIANEYAISIPTVYNIRRRVKNEIGEKDGNGRA